VTGCDFKGWQAARLARFHAALDATLPAADTYPARLHTAMRYATQGGKRLRALLVYAAGEALGAAPEALDAPAVAAELIHAFSLVHDDLPAMDDDDLRRGAPTVHKAFDEGTAVLVGDALQTLAFEALAAAPLPGATVLALVRTLAEATGSRGMTGGQQADLEAEGVTLALPDLERLHAHKTGALVLACTRMAALAAGRAAGTLDAFGTALGLAYQIQDDVLDATESSATLGKTAGKDAAAAKSTYATLLGLDAARAAAAAQFAAARHALPDDATSLGALLDRIAQRSH
jgi:farnesyl diphosphate synthase